MTESTIYSIVFIAVGLFAIFASLANWDFFFNSRKAAIFIKIFGRNGARIFYILLGLAISSIGILNLTGIITL